MAHGRMVRNGSQAVISGALGASNLIVRNLKRALASCALALMATVAGKSQDAASPGAARPGLPVMVQSWSEIPAALKQRWQGEPCGNELSIDKTRPIQFHRMREYGPLIALVPCAGMTHHDEVWRMGGGAKRLSLPVPSLGPQGGFAEASNLGTLTWDNESNSLISTVGSDMIPDLAWRRTYIWSGGLVLIKVESAMNRPYPYQWQTEWEAMPWRSLPKGPLAGP